MSDTDDFEIELKKGFLEEASALLLDAEKCFLDLERSPQDKATLEQIFRIAHNLKGSSKAVGFSALGAFTHEFENFLLKCKNGSIAIVPETVSLLLKCNDHVRKSIEALSADLSQDLDSTDLLRELVSFTPPAEVVESIEVPEESGLPTVEEAALVAQAESIAEEPALAPAPQPTIASAPDPIPEKSVEKPVDKPIEKAHAADESIRVSLARLEKLLNFVGEMVILQTVLREQVATLGGPLLRATTHQMGKVTKEVQDLSMSLRMVPLKQTFQKMQRIVRDTAAQLGKRVDLSLEGEETEVDKTVLEALGDPLVHLVRNAVDHGIESPQDRVAKGKSETGKITLRAYHQGGRLVIEVLDDGGGIYADKLRKKAVEKGILKPTQALSDRDSVHLIFHPGFSTKAEVTEVSGRGVGMDVVKTNIEKIQGEVQVETTPGFGSQFKIVLPLTLAIIDGMIVRCGEDRFVIPLSHVQESVKVEDDHLQFATGLGEVLELRKKNLPVIRLSGALGKKTSATAEKSRIAVIIQNQSRDFAVMVDDIVGQHQVVIKKLGSELQHAKGYGGCAVLGDGKPALILELSELVSLRKKQEVA